MGLVLPCGNYWAHQTGSRASPSQSHFCHTARIGTMLPQLLPHPLPFHYLHHHCCPGPLLVEDSLQVGISPSLMQFQANSSSLAPLLLILKKIELSQLSSLPRHTAPRWLLVASKKSQGLPSKKLFTPKHTYSLFWLGKPSGQAPGSKKIFIYMRGKLAQTVLTKS